MGESSLEHPNPSGDGRRRITTKREPREVRDEQPTVTSSTPRGGRWGKRRHESMPWPWVTTQEAPDGHARGRESRMLRTSL